MSHTIYPAIHAASYGAGAREAVALLQAETLNEVADIVERCVSPGEIRNGFLLDPDAYRQGLSHGIAKVKEIAASRRGGGWLSPSGSNEISEVEEALMEGYFGA